LRNKIDFFGSNRDRRREDGRGSEYDSMINVRTSTGPEREWLPQSIARGKKGSRIVDEGGGV